MKYAVIVIIAILILLGAWWLLAGEGDVNLPNGNDTTAQNEDGNTTASEEDDFSLTGNVDVEVDSGDVVEINLTGQNFEFSQEEITVQRGDRVRITFASTGGTHDWVVDEFDAATERVNEGETTSVEFVADETGSFEYYCSVGQHRALGMVGTLIVE